jgi:membrane protease YdiL (CAAX protease family)
MTMAAAGPSSVSPAARLEAGLALGWFAVHSALQLVRPESEAGHWGTLVAIPLLGLLWLRRHCGIRAGLAAALRSVGLGRPWSRGLAWAIPLGLALSAAQLVLSRNQDAFWALIESGRALYLFPIAFVFLALTAGFTEEFFFRGVLQERIARWTGSSRLGLASASVAFALYHFPYAWGHPMWPTAGDAAGALRLSLVEGLPGGLILGTVYLVSGRNLVAAVVVHVLIDVLPVMTMIRFGGG